MSQISKRYDGRTNDIFYDIDKYHYPAYIAIDARNHSYEYALLLDQNRIIYVYLNFIKPENIQFSTEFLPINYENEITDEGDGYSIYLFSGYYVQ